MTSISWESLRASSTHGLRWSLRVFFFWQSSSISSRRAWLVHICANCWAWIRVGIVDSSCSNTSTFSRRSWLISRRIGSHYTLVHNCMVVTKNWAPWEICPIITFVAAVTSAARWARTSNGVSGCNLACKPAIYCSICILTTWISILEEFNAMNNPSILAWGVDLAGIYSVKSMHILLIKCSISICYVVARVHVDYTWETSSLFSSIFCSVTLNCWCTRWSLCWIYSNKEVWRTYNASCGNLARSSCTSTHAWTCVPKSGGLIVRVAPSKEQRRLSTIISVPLIVAEVIHTETMLVCSMSAFSCRARSSA